jgi:hypothetical protein
MEQKKETGTIGNAAKEQQQKVGEISHKYTSAKDPLN